MTRKQKVWFTLGGGLLFGLVYLALVPDSALYRSYVALCAPRLSPWLYDGLPLLLPGLTSAVLTGGGARQRFRFFAVGPFAAVIPVLFFFMFSAILK